MASIISEKEEEERKQAVKLLKNQIETEGQLIAQYQEYGAKVANLGVRRAAEKVLKYPWLRNTKGLRELIEGWRDEEKRHHQSLKKLSEKPFIEADPNDFITLFGTDEKLEERYLRSKRFREKQEK
ncbi:MAG: hypothetical protein ACXAEX_15330 [Promethearchaeota archaeon]